MKNGYVRKVMGSSAIWFALTSVAFAGSGPRNSIKGAVVTGAEVLGIPTGTELASDMTEPLAKGQKVPFYALSEVGRACALQVASDFFSASLRVVRIFSKDLMPGSPRMSEDRLGRNCNSGQDRLWTVAAGEKSEDLPLNFGWEKRFIAKLNDADLPVVVAAGKYRNEAVEIEKGSDGMYTVSVLSPVHIH